MTGISDKTCSRKFRLNKISRIEGANHRFSIGSLQSYAHKTIHKKINFIGLCAHNAINPKVPVWPCSRITAYAAILICGPGTKKEQQEPLRMCRSRMLSQSFKSILELAIDKVGVNLGR